MDCDWRFICNRASRVVYYSFKNKTLSCCDLKYCNFYLVYDLKKELYGLLSKNIRTDFFYCFGIIQCVPFITGNLCRVTQLELHDSQHNCLVLHIKLKSMAS